MHEALETWSRGPFRVELRCDLEFTGPLHVGAGEVLSLATDAPVLRDAGGKVWLPGSSVRGVLADWCQREAPLLGIDRAYVQRLFGVTPGRGAGAEREDRQGRLTVLDLALESAPTRIRDHVKIHREWGAAATGAKFDQEIAHPRSGTLRLIYEGDGWDDPELVLLRSVVEALREGLLAFGGKTGWGLGATRIKGPGTTAVGGPGGLNVSCLDRTVPEDLSRYLSLKLPGNAKQRNGTANAKTCGEMAKPLDYSEPRSREPDEPVAWSWLRLDLLLPFDGPMLVAALDTTLPGAASSFARERREADATWQVGPDGQAVLAGSALRGPLRSDAERIAKTLGLGCLADILFGSEKPRRQGLLRVEEGHVEGEEKAVFLNHVSIDRVTGFAAEGRLFNVAALASPRFRSRLLVRWNAADERHRQAVALLLFVLRDGAERGLWIGSRTTRGYGYARTVVIESVGWSIVGADSPTIARRREPEGQCDEVTVSELGERLGFVQDAWNSALEKRKDSVRAP